MKSVTLSLAILGVSAKVLGAAIPKTAGDAVKIDYDAIIVGGGPSGLSALSGLARVRRNVLLIDSGKYRNAQTRHMHDLIGFDGVTPAWYRYSARKQLQNYDTIQMTNGTVNKIEPVNNNTYFRVMAELPGDQPVAMTARKIVLATGLQDDLPDTPGLRENFGKGIFWCPWCDGHEHADQALGLIGPLTSVPSSVRQMLSLNRDVVVFTNGTNTPANRKLLEESSPDWETYLELNNITIDNRIIKSITRLRDGEAKDVDPALPSVPQHDVFRVDFEQGPSVERNAFLSSFNESQASQVGPDMGVNLLGGRLAVNSTKGLETNIPGVYAIGDANSDNVTNIPHALFSGKRTAVFLHVQLGREDEAAQLRGYKEAHSIDKRSVHETARSVWDMVTGKPGDALYAGDFEQRINMQRS